MRVLHIITGLDVGGAELQVRMLLQHTRHDGEVLALYNPATVADGLNTISAPFNPSARQPSGKCRS